VDWTTNVTINSASMHVIRQTDLSCWVVMAYFAFVSICWMHSDQSNLEHCGLNN